MLYSYGNNWLFAAFSPDGRHILWAENNQDAEKYVLHLEEIETGVKTWSSALAKGITTATFSPDGKNILAGLWGGGLRLLDIATGIETASFSGKTIASKFSYSPAGNIALSGANLWDITNGIIVTRFQGVDGAHLILSPDGKNALAKEQNFLFDRKTGNGITVFPEAEGDLSFNKTIFSPDGRYILNDFEGILKLWDINNGNIKTTFKAHETFPGTDAIAFSPDSRYIISSGRGKEEKAALILWDINRVCILTFNLLILLVKCIVLKQNQQGGIDEAFERTRAYA